MPPEEILFDAEERMEKVVRRLEQELTALRIPKFYNEGPMKSATLLQHMNQMAVDHDRVQRAHREISDECISLRQQLAAHKDACAGVSALVAAEPEAIGGGALVEVVKAVLERLKTRNEELKTRNEELAAEVENRN